MKDEEKKTKAASKTAKKETTDNCTAPRDALYFCTRRKKAVKLRKGEKFSAKSDSIIEKYRSDD